MEYIIILDHSDNSVIEGTINNDEDVIDILNKHNLKESQCSWITSSEPFNRYNLDELE